MSSTVERTILEAVLDQARWAPSGDNTQPWRFEIVAPGHVVIHGFDTRDHCVYDLDGTSSQLAFGALIETMAIAASTHGIAIEASRRPDAPDTAPVFAVHLRPDPSVRPDPLRTSIESRSVQRRMLKTRPLTSEEKAGMKAAVGDRYELVWMEGAPSLRRMARLLFVSAKLRLTMPEAYLVHRDAIEWGTRFSHDRVPEAAVGLDSGTALLMRWVMRRWSRVAFFNRFLAGTWAPRLQLDVLPALRCAAHFVLTAANKPDGIDDFVDAGRAMQRLWLTATDRGLQLQPEMTPLIFARYSREARRFSSLKNAEASGREIASGLQHAMGAVPVDRGVFMGRIGEGAPAQARSLRLPLGDLMYDAAKWPAQKERRAST